MPVADYVLYLKMTNERVRPRSDRLYMACAPGRGRQAIRTERMEGLFEFGDDLGPVKIVHVRNPGFDLRGILVIDNVAAGPAIGGLRMAPDVGLEECVRLARAMTLKNALSGLCHGGAKSVLIGDPRMPPEQKERLVRAFASALEGEQEYIFGPDMGTNEMCMAWVKDEIGRAVGLPREIGGIPLDEVGATGWGVSHAADVAAPYAGIALEGARVVIQGFGAVGKNAARYLVQRGAVLIAASDSKGAIYDPDGLDVDALIRHKSDGLALPAFEGGEAMPRDALIETRCDIWIPAARPDVINEGNVDLLDTRLLIQGANIPVTLGAERRLHERGVLSVPDVIANAGGVICAAMEYHHAEENAVFQVIEQKIRANTEEVLRRAKGAGSMPRDAALEIATERVRTAMTTRRWGLR